MPGRNKPVAAPPPLPPGNAAKSLPTSVGPQIPVGTERRQTTAASPPPPPPSRKAADEDDDFLKSIVDGAALRKEESAVASRPLPSRQGLVLARDSDGFERLMDASLVSADAIVVRTGEQVKCPGCGDWFSDEKAICPVCFRENWQGAGGQKRKRKRALQVIGSCLGVGLIAGLVLLYGAVAPEIVLPLELKIFLWVASPFLLSGVMVWLRRQAME